MFKIYFGNDDPMNLLNNGSGWSFIAETGFVDTNCILRIKCHTELREMCVVLAQKAYSCARQTIQEMHTH